MQIDVAPIIDWIVENWIIFAVIGGVIVVGIIVLMLLPAAKVKDSPDFPADTAEANDLAIGFMQIRNADGAWNDALGTDLAKDAERKAALVELWGLTSHDEWVATIDRLVNDRRRRPLWQSLLQIRADLIKSTGVVPSRSAWLKGIKAAGGTGKGDERSVVDAVSYYEDEFRKITSKDVFPKSSAVTNLDGYALNQAAAVAVWGIALGIATPEESRARLREISDIARSEFASWGDFGRSVVVGRAMHWSDGQMVEKQVKMGQDYAHDFERAMNPKVNGPWSRLAWRR